MMSQPLRQTASETPGVDPYIDLAMLLNVVDVLVPIALIAVKHTITINANITAYSTAVGPASETRKQRNFRASDFMSIPPIQVRLWPHHLRPPCEIQPEA